MEEELQSNLVEAGGLNIKEKRRKADKRSSQTIGMGRGQIWGKGCRAALLERHSSSKRGKVKERIKSGVPLRNEAMHAQAEPLVGGKEKPQNWGRACSQPVGAKKSES